MGEITNATSGILTSVNRKFDTITGIAKGILCIPQILSPDGLKYITSQILATLNRQVASLIVGMTGLVTSIVTRAINQITGRIGAELSALNFLLKDINEAINLIKNSILNLDDRASSILDFLKDQENCKFAAAELGKCIVGDLMRSVTNKFARDINKGTKDIGTEVNNLTSSLFDSDKSITKFVRRTQYFANKASTQQRF